MFLDEKRRLGLVKRLQKQITKFDIQPRLQAEAEVGWTKKELKNFDDFSKRLTEDYLRLDKLGIYYRDHTKE